MPARTTPLQVYLEVGEKKIFAGAVDWPGWCRSGKTEEQALETFLEYGQRYHRVLSAANIPGLPLQGEIRHEVVERLIGSATTDFGAPGAIPEADWRPLDPAGLRQHQAVLEACWGALDRAAQAAAGKELRKGPRGGGRELEAMLRHVREAQVGYLKAAGAEASGETALEIRASMRKALEASARGEIPEFGQRGGKRWPARYFTRRSAWHILDHAWEIEDRVEG